MIGRLHIKAMYVLIQVNWEDLRRIRYCDKRCPHGAANIFDNGASFAVAGIGYQRYGSLRDAGFVCRNQWNRLP